MSGTGRPLLAARTSSGEKDSAGNTSPGPHRPHGASRAKRTLIESACSACRRRKSRCDGLRPTCSRCQNLRTDCHYEAEEGESRWSALRRRNQILEAERDQLRELMAFVQNRPEAEAQDIFQRIRSSSYDDVFMLLRAIKDGAMNMQQPPSAMTAMNVPGLPTAASGVDQRLPPIHAIFDHPRRPSPPAHLVHNHSLSSEDSTGSMPSELATNMSTPVPGAGPPPVHRAPLNTLEPSLQQHPHGYMRGTPATLSSEESTSSVLSTSLDGPPNFPPPQERSVAGPDPPQDERLPYYVNGQHVPGQHGGPYYN
ncbi:Nitrogen assimilation transcription factor nit-4 [Fulvia fulva]|uniref:Nitrogen assimilation transcription factor nit-4 n=1 Tax=Passalora fulva TaxID=5499 RepID=A0A9Q8UUS7_PASFU|nr:Nitrogen assimilation transcription factor nit-4 [Fulvia fulva]KAK4627322.1 Nitrogen assimilation transcription factor nit-4 [Fulvia fulva]KAK4627420.1 Nitrogen assimilation transcription factor nit-4 [Fulvia fulva]UJO23213.1 Nitrogen assimilation transcription factor nit-4 [Fulvia fulva]WPV14235.1 Nitrogen assimilation transcription factor nit-4 [Fulvia fulva]WPV28088.1 Nitrogen assimilation transcription factor nit-4 [Fulvia fulva]